MANLSGVAFLSTNEKKARRKYKGVASNKKEEQTRTRVSVSCRFFWADVAPEKKQQHLFKLTQILFLPVFLWITMRVQHCKLQLFLLFSPDSLFLDDIPSPGFSALKASNSRCRRWIARTINVVIVEIMKKGMMPSTSKAIGPAILAYGNIV